MIMMIAKLFQNGHGQTVGLPEAFRFAGSEVYIKKVGNAVVLLPIENPWDALFQSLPQFSEDFMNEREQPETQEREEVFE